MSKVCVVPAHGDRDHDLGAAGVERRAEAAGRERGEVGHVVVVHLGGWRVRVGAEVAVAGVDKIVRRHRGRGVEVLPLAVCDGAEGDRREARASEPNGAPE